MYTYNWTQTYNRVPKGLTDNHIHSAYVYNIYSRNTRVHAYKRAIATYRYDQHTLKHVVIISMRSNTSL